MPVAYTNFDISNVYKGRNSVNKIMKGNVLAWPPTPAFSFNTYRSGGDLNFTVTSDTDYIACTVNDSEVFIYKTSDITAKAIRVLDTIHILESTSKVIDISLPLYARKYVRISGNGTRLARYGIDYNNGKVVVEVINPYGSAINYTVTLTGKGSITKNCPVGTTTSFIFTSVPQGTRTVTLTDLADSSTTSTQVVINTNSSPIGIQNLTLGISNTADGSVGTILNDIKVYSITEDEALNSLYGTTPVISVEQIYDGAVDDWLYEERYYRIIFRIISGGSGLPPNSEIQVRWDDAVTIKKGNPWTYDLVYSTYTAGAHVVTLITDSVGKVTQLGPGTLMDVDPVVLALMPSGWSWGFAGDGHQFQSASWSLDASGEKITMAFFERSDLNDQYYGRPQDDAEPGATFVSNWVDGGEAGINFIGTDKPISLVEHTTFDSLNTVAGTWSENLLFDNRDLVGNLQSVELKDINIENITSTSQRELKVIQSNYINTTTNKNGNSNVKITNTPNFEAMYGNGATLEYLNDPTFQIKFTPTKTWFWASSFFSSYSNTPITTGVNTSYNAFLLFFIEREITADILRPGYGYEPNMTFNDNYLVPVNIDPSIVPIIIEYQYDIKTALYNKHFNVKVETNNAGSITAARVQPVPVAGPSWASGRAVGIGQPDKKSYYGYVSRYLFNVPAPDTTWSPRPI